MNDSLSVIKTQNRLYSSDVPHMIVAWLDDPVKCVSQRWDLCQRAHPGSWHLLWHWLIKDRDNSGYLDADCQNQWEGFQFYLRLIKENFLTSIFFISVSMFLTFLSSVCTQPSILNLFDTSRGFIMALLTLFLRLNCKLVRNSARTKWASCAIYW